LTPRGLSETAGQLRYNDIAVCFGGIMRILTVLGAAILLLTLTACGSSQTPAPTADTSLIYTQAAQTVVVQLIQTSAAQTALAPTDTPQPTFTSAPTVSVPTLDLLGLTTATNQPLPAPPGVSTPTLFLPPLPTPTGPLCNDSVYIRDVGTKDGTVLKPGQAFAKGWLIQNTGVCKWTAGYRLVRVGGNTDFGGATFVIRYPNQEVAPGAIAEISLNLVAPKQPGTYEGRYQMYTDLNVPFGTGMTVAVEVRK